MPSMRQSQQHPCGLSRTPASQTLLSGSTAPRSFPPRCQHTLCAHQHPDWKCLGTAYPPPHQCFLIRGRPALGGHVTIPGDHLCCCRLGVTSPGYKPGTLLTSPQCPGWPSSCRGPQGHHSTSAQPRLRDPASHPTDRGGGMDSAAP